MQSSHAAAVVDVAFDDPNLIADDGPVPVVAEHVTITGAGNGAGANPAVKVMSLLAGMVAGADSITDVDRLRHAGNAVVFDEIRAPSTLGTFLRALTHGHVQQLNAVLRKTLVRLARRVPLLPGAEEVVFVDLDSTKHKPIDKVNTGDKVIATDPVTGKTQARTVVATIIGAGQKHLVDITVDTDGPRGTKTGSVIATATANHPSWAANKKAWIDADKLHTGEQLRTADGQQLTVTTTRHWTAPQRVHYFTIEDIHTYYVMAGTTPVLVHNDDPLPTQLQGRNQPLTNKQAADLAKYLGYKKTNFRVRGQAVFTNGKAVISQDIGSGDGSHNGGTWKLANSADDLGKKITRTATTDALLNKIGC